MDRNAEPEIAEYPEAGPFWVGLWAVARHWVALLEQVFEPDLIAEAGITRSFALRCSKWLWSIEGLVRRLIIAAAMKLDTALLPRLTKGKERPSAAVKPASASFIVLPRLPGRRPSCERADHASSGEPPEHRHLVVPADDLLNLFPRHDRRNARPAYRRSLNPLHRRGRRSRWDPDYRCDDDAADARVHRHFFGPFRKYPHCPQPRPLRRPRADRSSPYWKPPGGGVPEWKRIDQEWARVIPSPRIAARIKALLRVMQAPERWVERTARRLNAEPGLLPKIRAMPPLAYRRPKLDRGAPPPFESPLAEAQALLDTS